MTTELSRHPRIRNLVAFFAPVVAVAALAGAVAVRINTSTELAQSARNGAMTACDAVHASNVKTIAFLTTAIVPAPGSPRYDEAQAFVDGLASAYETVYADCIAGIR